MKCCVPDTGHCHPMSQCMRAVTGHCHPMSQCMSAECLPLKCPVLSGCCFHEPNATIFSACALSADRSGLSGCLAFRMGNPVQACQ
eukprot:1138502-Pelagomonas_calceolata.AAC.1